MSLTKLLSSFFKRKPRNIEKVCEFCCARFFTAEDNQHNRYLCAACFPTQAGADPKYDEAMRHCRAKDNRERLVKRVK